MTLRFHLRTLHILLAVGPPALAATWFAWPLVWLVICHAYPWLLCWSAVLLTPFCVRSLLREIVGS